MLFMYINTMCFIHYKADHVFLIQVRKQHVTSCNIAQGTFRTEVQKLILCPYLGAVKYTPFVRSVDPWNLR